MAHELEIVNGEANMAYVGEVPWHGLGKRVPSDVSPQQMLEAANLNWTVEKVPMFYNTDTGPVLTKSRALIRSSDKKLLTVINDSWNPVQNQEAFEFFNDFVAHGDMSMETAGSLKDGKIIWALAKVKDSFDLFGGKDRVDAYLHFTNPHQYGQSIDVRFTPIRVVCNNTLTLSLNQKANQMVKVSHRREFNGDEVKEMLGVAKEKLATYKEMAAYLGSKRYTNESLSDYFKRVFPVTTGNKDKEMSRNAKIALDVMEQQPGANFAEGSWWQAFNAVTFMSDHVVGRSADTRLQSAWFGYNKNLKTKALETAVEMAEAA